MKYCGILLANNAPLQSRILPRVAGMGRAKLPVKAVEKARFRREELVCENAGNLFGERVFRYSVVVIKPRLRSPGDVKR